MGLTITQAYPEVTERRSETVDNIAIIGVGLIGGSLGLAFKRFGISRSIIGISREETLKLAADIGAIDDGYPYSQLAEGVAMADVVFLCTPIARILKLVREVISCASPGTIVTDVGSTKSEITAAARSSLKDNVYFIGGHPMAGSERRGVGAADPFLFQNAIYVLTPSESVPEAKLKHLTDIVDGIGARVVVIDPELHDRIAAAVSHLPQMISVALVNMAGKLGEDEPLFLKMAAGGFRDMTRIASSPYQIWKDICQTNTERIAEFIDLYTESISEIKNHLQRGGLEEDFDYGNRVRGSIPKDSKGFISSLQEILVVVEDKPGVIAKISGALAAEKINIKDIEVLKVRENEGGTLRLAFDSRSTASRAIEIIRKAGYEARLR